MKKVVKLVGIIFFITFLTSTIDSKAGRCQDLCIPQSGGTCAIPIGDNGDITVCGGAQSWSEI